MIYSHPNSSSLISILNNYLPNSLPLLCRLQNPQRSQSSLMLATFSPLSFVPSDGLFTAAYIDQSRRGESQAWFFCSFEKKDQGLLSAEELERVNAQVRDMLRYIKSRQSLEDLLGSRLRELGIHRGVIDEEDGLLFIASLHPLLVNAIQDTCPTGDVRLSRVFMKYLFGNPPPPPTEVEALQEGLEFGELRSEDMARVIDTSSIKRNRETLLLLENAAVFSVTGDNKVAIAWAFISFDGSLATWWVEDEWRGKGIGKAVVKKVLWGMWEGTRREGVVWVHADVAEENLASKRGLVGLGGAEGWSVRWLWVDLKGFGRNYRVDVGGYSNGAGQVHPNGSS